MRPDERRIHLARVLAALLLVALVGLGVLAVKCLLEPGAPHVALIIIDTLRADALGVSGAGPQASPEIDHLAEAGVLFERVIAPSTWTRPSTGAMLTGLSPRRLGLYSEANEVLPQGVLTLAEVLQQAGYRTLGATANPHLNSSYNFDQGFDEYFDSDRLFPVQLGRSPQEHRFAAHTAREILEPLKDLVRTDSDEPTYVQVNLMDVHEYSKVQTPAVRRSGKQDYQAAVRDVAREVGVWIDEMMQLPGWDNSIFVITSDHGETLGDHPGVAPRGHGQLVYSSQAHVPLVLFSPNQLVTRGRRVSQQISLLDLMPTVLELAGLPVPVALEGRSRAALAAPGGHHEEQPSSPDPAFVETLFRSNEKVAVYLGEWLYIEHRDAQTGTDPAELQRFGQERGRKSNRLGPESELSRRLARLLRHWEETNPPEPPIASAIEPNAAEIEQLKSLGYLQ